MVNFSGQRAAGSGQGMRRLAPARRPPLAARSSGYTLLEAVVSMAIFGMFLAILGMLTVEMRRQEKRLPVNFMRHPQIVSVVSKLRRDVLDAFKDNPYPTTFHEYTQTSQTLIIESIQPSGSQTIVWDFRTPGEVKRISWNVGVATTWTAHGVPPEFSNNFEIDAVGIPGRPFGVRITAKDEKGRLAIDQILQPRIHP